MRAVIARMAATLASHNQRVLLVAPDAEGRAAIAADGELATIGERLQVIDCASDDIWARDFGPFTVVAGNQRRFVDFCFDGWGGRYPAGRDDRVTRRLFDAGAFGAGGYRRVATVLEGGSVEANGDAALLTTRRCLLDNNRNPGFTARDFEALFAAEFGVETVHWLAHGELIGDDTDGHIDTLARFVDKDTIVYQSCDDPDDPHYGPLAAMAAELAGLRDRRGRAYRLAALPLPGALHDPDDGHRLPAGYANFVIANRCLLMPAFDDPADALAKAVLQRCFPQRDVVAIDARPVVRHHGSLHCLAMQVPELPADG